MFCSKCGAQLQGGVAFCSQCGNSLSVESPQPSVSAPADIVRPKKSSKISTILTYVAAGFVVLIFGSAIIGMMSDGGEDSSDQSSSSSAPNSSIESITGSGNEAGSANLPGLGEGARTKSGVEAYAVSFDIAPYIPNVFVVDEKDVKGQLVSIRFDVVNGSNEEISISTGSFYSYIGSAEYEPIAVFSDDGEWYLYEPLGAGLGVTVDVYFDIPAGKSISGAKYQTSLFLGEEIEFAF